jgi:hypothetical protein
MSKELDIPMSAISYEETDDSDSELPFAEMSKEQQERFDRKLWRRQFPSGVPPYPTPFTPETESYWRRWATAKEEAREDLEKLTEAEVDEFNFKEPEDETSSSVSTRPAAIPKAAGRCREGRFCPDLATCTCIYDTSSNVSMGSAKSVPSQNFSPNGRNEGDRPGTPDPRYDPDFNFTIADLDLQVGVLDDQDKPPSPPSVIWTDNSVQSTLPSVIETDISVASTMPSIASTAPSVLVLEEIDWRFQCRCGERMGRTEQVATWEFLSRYPAPFVCHNCRWATVGL